MQSLPNPQSSGKLWLICQSNTNLPIQCQSANPWLIPQLNANPWTIDTSKYPQPLSQTITNLWPIFHSLVNQPNQCQYSANLIIWSSQSHTHELDKCVANLVSNANSPIWYQSWTNPPIHCQSLANPIAILDQSSDQSSNQLQVHLPIQWQSWINRPIQWHSCTHLPLRQQARLWGPLKIPHLPHILNMVAHRPIPHSSHINCSWQFV